MKIIFIFSYQFYIVLEIEDEKETLKKKILIWIGSKILVHKNWDS